VVASGVRAGYAGAMTRTFGAAPTASEIEELARAALARLPEPFAGHLGEIVLAVEDFADADTLAELGIDDPFELTGLYEGVPVGDKASASGNLPDRIRLFRSPLLDEWIAREDEALESLVTHVLVHEVGHHFGLSDDDMHALEDGA
jgi:predicted Zn-dependent protease with MMP-like domain